MISAPAAEVEQPPERERQVCRALGWPALGWLPDDLERLRALRIPYPLKGEDDGRRDQVTR